MNQQKFNKLFSNFIKNKSEITASDFLNQIKDGSKITAKRALEIYQEDYQARLTEALKNTYPAINSIIGDELFLNLAADYISFYPSTSSDLDDYGHKFSFFITTHQVSTEYIFLCELADFEWNFKEVFHQNQELGVKAIHLSEMLANNFSTIQLVKSARVLNYNYQMTSLFALKDNEEIIDNFEFNEPQFLVMLKNGLRVKFQILSKAQWMIVKNILTPSILAEIFNIAPPDMTPDEMQKLFEYFGTDRLLLKLNQNNNS